jgi:SET domain-containing protein
MNKQELLKNLKENIYCRIGISKVHGVGVIAIKDIPKGINPYQGIREEKYIEFTEKEIELLDTEVRKMIKDFFVIADGKTLIPEDGLNSINISFFQNHSPNPNVTTLDGETFITLKEIKKGEELTYDYTTSYGEENRPAKD